MSSRPLRLRACHEGDGDRDRGTTLAELIVVMFVMGLIMAAVTSLTIGFQRTNAQSIARQDQLDSARTAVERMSKTLRTAIRPNQLPATCTGACASTDAFQQAGSFSVQFYANLDNSGNSTGPRRVTYTIATTGADAGVLVEKVQRPESSTPGALGYQYCDAEALGATSDCKQRLTVQRLASGVRTDDGAVLRYYDGTGTLLVPASNGLLSAGDLAKVLSIELVLSVQSQAASAPDPTQYIQRVMLPNAQAVQRPAGGAATP